ncbi:hypothetical protein HRI_003353300 [Hibiscus trionum]|uniref:Uncharacterized protein n=1 Tax=Hibiscus trionum TaxID=183268 RepID=A0A9W7III8_HIBTR|nr:hypothetical protein HRI_003353300 [Hibiscus trionum]
MRRAKLLQAKLSQLCRWDTGRSSLHETVKRRMLQTFVAGANFNDNNLSAFVKRRKLDHEERRKLLFLW